MKIDQLGIIKEIGIFNKVDLKEFLKNTNRDFDKMDNHLRKNEFEVFFDDVVPYSGDYRDKYDVCYNGEKVGKIILVLQK